MLQIQVSETPVSHSVATSLLERLIMMLKRISVAIQNVLLDSLCAFRLQSTGAEIFIGNLFCGALLLQSSTFL